MSQKIRPHLHEPLTASEIDRLHSRARSSAVALVTVTFVLSTYGFTQLGNPFLFALLMVLGIIANCVAWEVASEMWKKYSDLPMENCASANQLFGQRRELEAYRQTILQMGRPFVWADYWTASQFKSDIFGYPDLSVFFSASIDHCDLG